MKYYIERLNRTVDLDDDLVSEYCKYEKLRDQPFSIVVRAKYGCAPTEEQVSNVELSKICNEVLLSDLKSIAMMPKVIEYVESHYEDFIAAAENGEFIEHEIE